MKAGFQRAIRDDTEQDHWNEVHNQLLAIQRKAIGTTDSQKPSGENNQSLSSQSPKSNQKENSAAQDIFQSDVSLVYYINTEGTHFADSPCDWNTEGKFNRLPKGAEVIITDTGEKEHFNNVSDEMKWVKVHLESVPFKKYEGGFKAVFVRYDGWVMKKYLSLLAQQPVSDEGNNKTVQPYPPAASAFHGIAPYKMAFEKQTPGFEFSLAGEQIAAGPFMLTPNCIKKGDKTEVVYYTATDYGKSLNAYIVGPGDLDTFITYNSFYAKHAQEGAQGMQTFEQRQAEANPSYNHAGYSYQDYSAMAMSCGMKGDWGGYWHYLGKAWGAALTDPFWWANVGTMYVVTVPETPVVTEMPTNIEPPITTETPIITEAPLSDANLTLRSDITLSGGRSGELVKDLTGPPNSVLKGSQGRIYITNSEGEVIWDITIQRAKPVTPGVGFTGEKMLPTKQQLNFLNQIWGE
jgi:hypothetical protein